MTLLYTAHLLLHTTDCTPQYILNGTLLTDYCTPHYNAHYTPLYTAHCMPGGSRPLVTRILECEEVPPHTSNIHLKPGTEHHN